MNTAQLIVTLITMVWAAVVFYFLWQLDADKKPTRFKVIFFVIVAVTFAVCALGLYVEYLTTIL